MLILFMNENRKNRVHLFATDYTVTSPLTQQTPAIDRSGGIVFGERAQANAYSLAYYRSGYGGDTPIGVQRGPLPVCANNNGDFICPIQ
jgi:hypothetical protein